MYFLIVISILIIATLSIVRYKDAKAIIVCDEGLSEDKRLHRVRSIYIATSYLLILIVLYINSIHLNKNFEILSFRLLLIHCGIGGLIAEMGILKLPISPISKLYTIINIICLVIGALSLVDYYLFNSVIFGN